MILPKVDLTPSGRPKLGVGEIERVLLDKVHTAGSIVNNRPPWPAASHELFCTGGS